MSATENTAPLQGPMLMLAAIVLASANFIAVLDMTIANVSVPSIAGSLAISSSQGTWIITSYSVAEAITVPLTGWVAGRFGAVRVFTTAMAIFGLFSMLCGFAGSLETLAAARVLQGLSGGFLMPLSQTLLLRIFPPQKAGAAMGLWAMTTLTAPVFGPIIGGYLCDNYAWPIIFFINVPLALACSPLAFSMLRRYKDVLVRAPIDLIGLALLVVFVGSLQLMLDLGKEHDWFESNLIVALAIVAMIGFAAFLIWELTEEHPVVDVRIFRHRGFAAGTLTLGLGFGSIFASNVLAPLWLQSYMGYTPTWAGLTTAWAGVLAVVVAPLAGSMVGKVDQRWLVFGGLMWLAMVMVLRTNVTTDMGYWQIVPPLLLMGAGLPFFFVPLTTLTLSCVEERETASAAGLGNFVRTLSGAVGTSLVTTAWDDKTAHMHDELSGLVDRTGEAAKALSDMGLSPEAVLQRLDMMTQSQAVMLATNEIHGIVILAFVFGACLIWLAPKAARKIDITQTGH